MPSILKVKGLSTTFSGKHGDTTVVDGVDFELGKGEILGIVGESGCGKSVTSLSILQLLGKKGESSGVIQFNDMNLLEQSEKAMRGIRGRDISMIFQDPMSSLNPILTIGKQIGEMIEIHEEASGAERKLKVIGLLKKVGIPRAEEIYREYPHRLSGGMKQRVMIAMAIACNPAVLIADEPTTALDVTIQAQVLDLLKGLQKELNMSIILITHDLGVVAEMCDRVVVMYAGQVVETADTRTLLRSPKHPYAKGLVHSASLVSNENKRLNSIPGQVPLPGQFSSGCRFADRCEYVLDVCRRSQPSLSKLDKNTTCRCWLYGSKEAVQ
ncbi:ABC transporter ATP-binding protein [Fictibacillus fluitans]|uniref:ABC transporter ATP-binding protein n=1 Tax=Fictibacillus fluitans TaxID=3058422 RepID=A0ABT8HTD0_9BACL|nr:ABC transporter ATP-binding protein [Fictibacillus sp. NE201]MDN4524043.1 ABC transporter ATP-binding protein [Fictibacillus sp. NE201]